MGGGLYRSVNAARDGDRPPADAATLGSVQPLDAAGIEPPGNPPPPAAEPAGEKDSAAGNSAVMAVGSLVSRLTGFLRTAAIAAALGAGFLGDAYTTAQFFPAMIYELLLGGILASVVVPVLVRRRKADADLGEAYTQRLLTLAVLALGAATLLTVAAAPWLTLLYAGSDKPEAYGDMLTALSRLMLPIMFFSGLSALFSGILNTRGHFAAPMWTPILNNVIVIGVAGLYLVLFGARRDAALDVGTAQIALLGGGTLLGIVVQTLGLWPALRRVGHRWRWRFDFRALGLRELGRLGGWVFCYVAVSQVGVFVVLRLLNEANRAGDVAGPLVYNNVYLLMMMAHGIVAVSIITALMPRMSAAAADGRHADVAADLARGTRITTAVLAPIAVCYAVLAQPIAVVLFERGAFTRDDSLATAPVLVVAALALVPFAVSQLFTFAFYALTDARSAALINVPVVALRIGVQVAVFVLLARSLTAAGMMAGNALSYLLALLLSAWLLHSRIGRIGLGEIAASFIRVLLAAGAATLAGLFVVDLVLGGGAGEAGRLRHLGALVVGGTTVCGVYGGAALLLRVREITQVVAMVRRKLGR